MPWYVLKTSMKIMLKTGSKVMHVNHVSSTWRTGMMSVLLQNEGEEEGRIMTVQKKEKVVCMFVTGVLMHWCSTWLQGSERAQVYKHYSSQENLCCSEKEFNEQPLHGILWCSIHASRKIFSIVYMFFSFVYPLPFTCLDNLDSTTL